MIFETVIICCTVLIMCPVMSCFAAVFYYPYYAGFNFLTLIANALKLICFNFPFAFFSQIFFIQPIVRIIFAKLFAKDIEARGAQEEIENPQSEEEVLADLFKQMNQLKADLAHERRRRKVLEQIVENQQ
jgi:hypothetical protein